MERFAGKLKVVLTALLVFLLLFSVLFLVRGWAEGRFGSVDSLREYIEGFGLYGPAILTLIQALQVVLPVLPGFLGCIVGASLFGALGGFWATTSASAWAQ